MTGLSQSNRHMAHLRMFNSPIVFKNIRFSDLAPLAFIVHPVLTSVSSLNLSFVLPKSSSWSISSNQFISDRSFTELQNPRLCSSPAESNSDERSLPRQILGFWGQSLHYIINELQYFLLKENLAIRKEIILGQQGQTIVLGACAYFFLNDFAPTKNTFTL